MQQQKRLRILEKCYRFAERSPERTYCIQSRRHRIAVFRYGVSEEQKINSKTLNMKYTMSYLLCLVISIAAIAQKNQTLYVGPGLGFDHGGIGLKAEYQPGKHIGIFGGAGYNLANIGANAGLIYNVLPDKNITPVLTAMYGYNAVIKVTYLGGGDDFAVYNGLTVGGGVDFKYGRNKRQKINVNLLFPLRSSSFYETYRHIEDNGEVQRPVYPVAVSFGWNYAIISQMRKRK